MLTVLENGDETQKLANSQTSHSKNFNLLQREPLKFKGGKAQYNHTHRLWGIFSNVPLSAQLLNNTEVGLCLVMSCAVLTLFFYLFFLFFFFERHPHNLQMYSQQLLRAHWCIQGTTGAPKHSSWITRYFMQAHWSSEQYLTNYEENYIIILCVCLAIETTVYVLLYLSCLFHLNSLQWLDKTIFLWNYCSKQTMKIQQFIFAERNSIYFYFSQEGRNVVVGWFWMNK